MSEALALLTAELNRCDDYDQAWKKELAVTDRIACVPQAGQ